jgi:glycerol-3-phosphate acyltransferase PlsY
MVYGGLSMMIGGLIFYHHGDNIKRLWEGKEKKLSRVRNPDNR